MRRLVAGLVLPLLLVASGCGEEAEETVQPQDATLADISVSGPTDEKPTIEFKAPLSFDSTESKILDEGAGEGDTVGPGSSVTVDYVGVNARDGAEFDSSWERGKPATFALGQVIVGLAKGLEGAHAGDRVLVGVASKDGYDPTGNGAAILKGDSLVFVVDVRKVSSPLSEAQGKPADLPATVPTLTLDDEGTHEKFTATQSVDQDPKELGVYTVIEGTGPEVQTGQSITVEYVGQLYPNGKVFDESWSNDQSISFPLEQGGLIEGWVQGLAGQRVGSRVILVIPSDLGYGEQGSPPTIPANADLIFAIDILQAT